VIFRPGRGQDRRLWVRSEHLKNKLEHTAGGQQILFKKNTTEKGAKKMFDDLLGESIVAQPLQSRRFRAGMQFRQSRATPSFSQTTDPLSKTGTAVAHQRSTSR